MRGQFSRQETTTITHPPTYLGRLRHTLLVIRKHLGAPVPGLLFARLTVHLEPHQPVRVAVSSKTFGVGTDNEGDAGERPFEPQVGMGHGRDGVKLPAGEEVLQLGLCVVGVGEEMEGE